MIHKIIFSLITVFWILGISQGYVLQGRDNFTEITVQFDGQNRLDIKAMMKQSGYEDRGEFLKLIQDLTGKENWDRNLKKGDKFFISSPVSETEIEFGDAESEMMDTVELDPVPRVYNPTYGTT